jgi:hypothetical protein
MKRIFVALMIFFGPLCWAGEPNLGTDNGVRAMHIGSSELPDEIAYVEFLKLVDSAHRDKNARGLYLQIVADALGIKLDRAQSSETLGRVRSQGAYFLGAYREMTLEELDSNIRVLCAGKQTSKSADQLYDAMNAVDDIRDTVRVKHLTFALYHLSIAERNSFMAYLNDLKTSISYVRIDSRKAAGSGEQDIRMVAEQSCNSFAADYQALVEELQ